MVTTTVALALLLLAFTLQDAFEVILLPRCVLRQLRFVSLFYRMTWVAWSALAARLPQNGMREHFLGVYGALSMVLLFGIWITGSQHNDQSWLAALAVIMDCCALIPVGLEGVVPLQARMTFTMARQILVEMARCFGVAPSRYTGGDRLDHSAFLRLQSDLADAGFSWGTPEAEELLAALRATYEPLLDGLTAYLLLPLQGWCAGDADQDHWVRGPRGTLARRLADELSETMRIGGGEGPERTRAGGGCGHGSTRP
jgi:hypothetical protein